MYRILFQQNVIGRTKLENGDPSMGCVSGLIYSSKPVHEFASFVIECGGKKKQGIFYLELNKDFEILAQKSIGVLYLAAVLKFVQN